MIKCELPKGDDPLQQIEECLRIIEEMDKSYEKREETVLDLSEVKWILPCSALLLSGKIFEIKNKGIEINYIEPKKEDVKKYLKDIGFPLGTERDGETFSPIKHFGNEKDINEEISKLLSSMENKIPENFGSSIPYILGELADNIEQHSKFSNASLMAQYYPQKNYVDIGVLDDGLTIPFVFEINKIGFSKDSEAINKALSGITTKGEELSRGYGLKSSKEIVEKALNGEMYIISRKGALIINPDSEIKHYDFKNTYLKGTLVYMRLKSPDKHLNIYPYLE